MGGLLITYKLQIDNLQIDNRQIDNRQIDNQNLQIDNLKITFFRAFSDMYTVQYSTMADLLNSIMFSRASYSGISFNMKSRVKDNSKKFGLLQNTHFFNATYPPNLTPSLT